MSEINKEAITDDMFELLDESEKNSEFIAMESKTFFQDAWGRYKKNKLALAGLIFLVMDGTQLSFVPWQRRIP